MRSIVALLLTMVVILTGLPAGQVTEENLSDFVAPDCVSTADFLSDNLALFAAEYNAAVDGENRLNATSCEWSCPVEIVTTGQSGVYLDFDGENGYMIVLDGYELAALETAGDLAYLRDGDRLYYSLFDGFLYEEDGEYLPYGCVEMTEDDYVFGAAIGCREGRDGTIFDPDLFVTYKYGDGFILDRENSLADFTYSTQGALSFYYSIRGGLVYTEGNCSLAAIYALMNYLQQTGKYPDLPASTDLVCYDATQDAFYEKYAADTAHYQVRTPKNVPALYVDVRGYAVEHYGFERDGTNPFNIATIIEETGKKYGCDVDAKHILLWSFESQVVKEIDGGHPAIWNTANSSSYGSHTMVVTGYKIYRKTLTVLGFKLNTYAKLMQVNDNWTAAPQYFDSTLYIGIGSFVKVR